MRYAMPPHAAADAAAVDMPTRADVDDTRQLR